MPGARRSPPPRCAITWPGGCPLHGPVAVRDDDRRCRSTTPARSIARRCPRRTSRPLERETGYVAPRTPTQATLAYIWSAVLGVARVGLHDDFFGLGGHSLLALNIVAQVHKQLGRALPVDTLFRAPTIARLAELLDADASSPAASPGAASAASSPAGSACGRDPAPPAPESRSSSPPASAYVFYLYDLARRLGPAQRLLRPAAPGPRRAHGPIGARQHARPDRRARLGRAARPAPRPYHLGGHSSGARRLRARRGAGGAGARPCRCSRSSTCAARTPPPPAREGHGWGEAEGLFGYVTVVKNALGDQLPSRRGAARAPRVPGVAPGPGRGRHRRADGTPTPSVAQSSEISAVVPARRASRPRLRPRRPLPAASSSSTRPPTPCPTAASCRWTAGSRSASSPWRSTPSPAITLTMLREPQLAQLAELRAPEPRAAPAHRRGPRARSA